jgi:hypothetical protein
MSNALIRSVQPAAEAPIWLWTRGASLADMERSDDYTVMGGKRKAAPPGQERRLLKTN